MPRSVVQLLDDNLEAIGFVQVIVASLDLATFEKDPSARGSVIYYLGSIGEASRLLLDGDDQWEARYPHVPWRSMVGFRNRVFHVYWATEYETVWHIAGNLPATDEAVREIRGRYDT